MQMFKKWDEGSERRLLEEKALIGLGYTNSNQEEQFKQDMSVGDIILVRRGIRTIALVEVISDYEDVGENDFNALDWFRFRRKVKVLAFAEEGMSNFPQPRGTLQKSINKYTRTYQYIDGWHKKTLNPKEMDMGLKIRELKIFNHKMFTNFSIDFLDENQKSLPLVLIAGKNGSGKTTILESIKSREDSELVFEWQGKRLTRTDSEYDEVFNENVIYLDAMIENDNEIEALLLEYIDYFIYEKSESAVVGAENLQKDMDEIFNGFDLNFHFKRIDYRSKKPIFSSEDAIQDDIEFSLKDLSTGERTLLSKMLYLHLKEPKNKLILVDEPETSLHPSWQNKILKFYENFAKVNNNQIIIATHSPNIIGSSQNRYLRVLRKDIDGKIESISGLKAHGRDINSILFDVMGEVKYRPKEFDNKIDKLHIAIDDRKIDEAKEQLEELKKDYGEDDTVIIEAEMLISIFANDA
jgi:AAA15 family ATPase/GTPase